MIELFATSDPSGGFWQFVLLGLVNGRSTP
jgi:hypothetical protein